MFKKRIQVGRAEARVYKTVTDWEAVGAAVFWGVVILALLGSCAG